MFRRIGIVSLFVLMLAIPACSQDCKAIIGCETCQAANSSACERCNQTANFAPDPVGNKCNCTTNFFLNNASCLECPASEDTNCQITFNGDRCCEKCKPSFYVNSLKGCQACETYNQNCISCEINKCLECRGEYSPRNTVCVGCSELNCTRCSNSSQLCYQCKTGFYITNIAGGQCIQCRNFDQNCTECTLINVCENCATRYFLNDTICQLCSSSFRLCLECSVGGCTKCETKTYNISGQCFPCSNLDVRCLDCSSATQCSSCEKGSYVAGDKCPFCREKFPNCAECETGVACGVCQNNTYVKGGECSTCDGIDKNCTVCTSDGKCIRCSVGDYVQNNICLSCSVMVGCLDCQNGTFCQRCPERMYFDDAKCSACADYCKECTKTVCKDCDFGLYPINTACQKCVSKWVLCVECTVDKCTTCEKGAVWDADKVSCIVCSMEIEGCISCSAPKICTECEDGRELSGDFTQCEAKSKTVIIIVACIVGAVVLIGAAFAVWKCLKKKKSQAILQDEDYDKL